MQILTHYFPQLSAQQIEQFAQLQPLYAHWNEQINVVSRKDMDQFFEHHVLHSLAIAKVHSFKKNEVVLDLGTGGGFPGIPLAILFPDTKFILCDSIAKKIKVAQEVIQALGLENATTIVSRAEALTIKIDHVVTRAVAPMSDLLFWTKKLHPQLLIALKGGDLKEELQAVKRHVKITPISGFFQEPYFETKKVVLCS